MRHHLLFAAALAAALPAAAQEIRPIPAAPEEAEQAEKADAAEKAEGGSLPSAGDEAPRDFGGAPDDAVGEDGAHTVERGDTLWDLSGKYLGNPWYWPKVWSFNPQIENPHWIYPGDRIRLGAGEARDDGGADLPGLSRGGFDHVGSDDVSVAGRIGVDLPSTTRAPTHGFVTDEQLLASGVIDKSWEEKAFLASGDRIYVSWPERSDLEIGGVYVVYRTDREITHPEGGTVGWITQTIGTARVVAADRAEQYVTAEILRSTSEIVRGDRIGPQVEELARPVSPRQNDRDLAGSIIATVEEGLGELGQGHVVFVDRGRKDGIYEGNSFEVIRAGDGLDDDGYTPYFDERLPKERIGDLLVIQAGERTSAAIVRSSIRELRIGDRVEMHAAAE